MDFYVKLDLTAKVTNAEGIRIKAPAVIIDMNVQITDSFVLAPKCGLKSVMVSNGTVSVALLIHEQPSLPYDSNN